MEQRPPDLHIRTTPTARVTRQGENDWRLEIPAHKRFRYCLAQLDDHGSNGRRSFPWRPPLIFSLNARTSAEENPGTWGFGFWNDPFSFLLGYEGGGLRLPSLPEAAWFFYASPHNYLSFRNDLPANGLLAATFSSTRIPPLVVDLASPLLGLTLIPGAAQWVRGLLRRFVKQDAVRANSRMTDWHAYRLEWDDRYVSFYMDEAELLRTEVIPRPPLSMVIWIDNQYAALPPAGRVRYGYLPNDEPAWLEIRDISVKCLT